MSANSKPWKLHKLCFLLQMLLPPHPNTSLLFWSPPCASFLAQFLFFPPHQGRAAHWQCESQVSLSQRLCKGSQGSASWPGPSVSCRVDCWAGLHVEAQRRPCPWWEGGRSRLYSQLSCDWMTPSLYSQHFVSSRSSHPHCQDRRCWAYFGRHTPEILIRSGCWWWPSCHWLLQGWYPCISERNAAPGKRCSHPHSLLRTMKLLGKHGTPGVS